MERNLHTITHNDETVMPSQSLMLTVVLPSETNPQADSLSAGNIMIRDIQQYNGGHPTMHDGQQFNMTLPSMHDNHQFNMGHPMRDGQQFSDADDIPPPKADFSAPPPYEVATKLPTYEEVQREKTLQGEHTPHTTRVPLAFLAIDTDAQDSDNENGLLGTDFMFFTAFLVAFLFNWIGFLLLMCFCHTIAARYGALSGFGLSLAKWTLIVKHSTDLASHENSWLWWLIMAFGLLICIRAIIQYLNIKRGWRLLSGSAQERLLFFY